MKRKKDRSRNALQKAPHGAPPVDIPNILPARAQNMAVVILICAVFFTGAVLRMSNMSVLMRSPDEQVYTYQAKIIAQNGIKGVALLLRDYNANKELWIYPPPTRIGYLLPLGAVMKMAHRFDDSVGAYVSAVFSVITLLLVILAGLRFFNPWIALTALLFLSVSPMDLAIARRTWQESFIGCLGFLLAYFCCEITRAPRRTVWFAPFVAVGSYCLLIKESGVLVYGICMLWLLWVFMVKERAYKRGALLTLMAGAGAFAGVAFLARVVGGFPAVVEVLRHIKDAMPFNTYAIEYQTCSAYRFLRGFWILTPFNSLMCLLGMAGAVFMAGPYQKSVSEGFAQNRAVVYGLIFFICSFVVITVFTPYCQNLRYVSATFAPFYIISALGLWYAAAFLRSRLKGAILYCALIILAAVMISVAAMDYRNFSDIFIRTGIKDISIRLIEEASI